MRLDKLLAHAGYGSRKDVKNILKKKIVRIDEKVATKGNIQVDPNMQLITVNGEKVVYEQYIYLMLHKPQDYLSATVDTKDKTVIDLVPTPYQHYSLAPVGRLDKDTEGLILLTNDGKLNHIMTSPRSEIYKTYFATIMGEVQENHISQFLAGITLEDGYQTKRAHLEIVQSGTVSKIKLAICEGKFHQVKRMFRAIGMEVTYLKRLSIGELTLDDTLQIGETRLLTEAERAYVLSLKG